MRIDLFVCGNSLGLWTLERETVGHGSGSRTKPRWCVPPPSSAPAAFASVSIAPKSSLHIGLNFSLLTTHCSEISME